MTGEAKDLQDVQKRGSLRASTTHARRRCVRSEVLEFGDARRGVEAASAAFMT
jgi:hypothetical protein